MRPEQSLDLRDRRCRFFVFLELPNDRTLSDAGYCAAANTGHAQSSDRTSKTGYSQAIAGNASTYAVRPSLLGIERSDRPVDFDDLCSGTRFEPAEAWSTAGVVSAK